MKFEDFYKEKQEKIFFYAVRKVSNKELAEDLCAETFFKVYKNWTAMEKWDDGRKLAWTYTVCRNQIIDHYRKNKPENIENIEEQPDDNYESIMSTLIKEESSKEIHTAMQKIDPEKQEVLELRFGQELKFSEIARIIGKSEGACKMLLYRSLQELKQHLTE